MDRLSDYDYELPESAIAQEPLADRAASRLLVVDRATGEIAHRTFRDLVDYLSPDDLLVLNDTRVSAVRLIGQKDTGARVEALLLRELGGLRWEALVKPGRRLRTGASLTFDGSSATVEEELPDGRRILLFDTQPCGAVPLPPYIHQSLSDPERYQTVYASSGGSAAAPTAGLHFTPGLLSELKARGVNIANVTLDVGLDTFRPVQSESLDEHKMHGEKSIISPDTAAAVRGCKGRIFAIGTTTVRTLESAAVGRREVEPGERITSIFIRPGFRFQVIDAMVTNFHMPRTTMLLMLAAFAGRENVMRAYAEALREGYRFLSFGDSMLIV